jgi:hypothetical protein
MRISIRSLSQIGGDSQLVLRGVLCGQASRRPLVVNKSEYRVVAGERVAIEAPVETLTFMRAAKSRPRKPRARAIVRFRPDPTSRASKREKGAEICGGNRNPAR